MQHFVIGTAGHIDHGKTSLIKALTNMDCDTCPEEKQRGITINPGFAYLKTNSKDYLAFVDVPGHHRFIGNMIAGASGIDFVMLVVAADDGVMPQTEEHLKICSLLGINNGVVVINKKDVADSEQLELCEEEIKDFTKGTFLEDKPVFKVSSHTKDGISELKDYLVNMDVKISRKRKYDFFRMYIDRSFNIDGFGLVVTGTVISGSADADTRLTVLPGDNEVRIRQIQRHEEVVETAEQGTRVALNLAGVKKKDISPGNILTARSLPCTDMGDVRLTLLGDFENIRGTFNALLLVGTKKLSVKVKLLAEEGDYAQIYFDERWYFAVGEYFVLRNTSSSATIGGGVIIDPCPLKHKKVNTKVRDVLRQKEISREEYILQKIHENIYITDIGFFEEILQTDKSNIVKLAEGAKRLKLLRDERGREFITDKEKYTEVTEQLLKQLGKFHRTNPLSVNGLPLGKIYAMLSAVLPYRYEKSNKEYLNIVLNEMLLQGKLEHKDTNWKLAGQRAVISDNERRQIAVIEKMMADKGMANIDMEELESAASVEGIDQRACKYILKYLNETGKIVRSGDICYYYKSLEQARKILKDYLSSSEEGITVAQYRDKLGANRKIAMQLFEIFEKEKLVYREGDYRFLR